jgi:tetratricopeptide (TPR) repeat protein
MMDAYEVNLKHLQQGAQKIMMEFQFGTPNEKQTVEEDGKMYEVHVYDRVNIKYHNGLVDSWEETKPLHDNPLPLAREALDKAVELDTDKKLEKKINPTYSRLAELFEREAIEAFLKDDFTESFKNFESSVLIGELPVMGGIVDTTVIFNTGMAASRAGLDEESIKYYEKALSYNYPEPSLYIFLKNKYFVAGDTAKGVDLLTNGFDRFPDNSDIVAELINYYLLTGKADEALGYITIAQEKDPSNVSLIFAEGTLYDKQGDVEKAVETYARCIEVDPEYYNAHYNMGVVHYNHAQTFYEKANDAPDSEYKSLLERGDEELKKAIAPMKKCHELKPEDTSVLETLKSIYYRLKMDEEYEAVKAKLE